MKNLLPYFAIGILTGIILSFFDLDITMLRWWVWMVILNIFQLRMYHWYLRTKKS